jgi:hypothetical protein
MSILVTNLDLLPLVGNARAVVLHLLLLTRNGIVNGY